MELEGWKFFSLKSQITTLLNLKVLKISATITKLHRSHTQDIKKKKKVKLFSNKVLLAKTGGGLICLTYLHFTLHFKLSKNLLTAVSIIEPIIIFILFSGIISTT